MMKKFAFLPVLAALALLCAFANTGAADLVVSLDFEDGFNDASGNGINGSPEGDAAIVFDEELNSNVLSLDGDDDVVRLDGQLFIDAGLDLLDEITVAMWVNTTQDVVPINFSGGLNTTWTEGGVHIKLNFGVVNVGINGGGADIVGTTTIPVNEWHHIAFTASATLGAVYYDGVMEGSRESDTGFPFFDMALGPVIGAWDNNPGTIEREWMGFKDDVRIYNHALTEDEMMELVESSAPSSVHDWSVH